MAGRRWRTQFWKGTTYGSFQQSLVEIGSIFSEKINCISIMMSFLTYITGFFYGLWTFTDFDRLCKLEKRGEEIKKIFYSETTEPISSNLGTFWLKIEQFWPFEESSIFSNGDHLGYRTALTDTILKGDHLRIISAKFGDFLWTLNFCRFWPIMQIRKKRGWN
jgi:hypothetical protein